MKILIIGNYHEGPNGWAIQLTNHILALDSAGVNVVPRRLNVTGQINPQITSRILELEKQDDSNPDIIIQNVLPNFLEKTGRTKCVSYFVCETSNFRATNWASRLNMMDVIACPCFHNKQAAIDSGVTKPIKIVPEAIDISKYNREYPVHPLRNQHKDKFIFLIVAEWTKRKNIEAIVRSFHSEFSPSEPVELVIKTTPVGMSNPQVDIGSRLDNVKRGLKLYNTLDRYKRENVICGFLSEQDLYSLYQSVDCVVNISRAEAFCIPVVDGMGFGKVVISPDHSGLDYVNDKNAYVVKSYEQPCFDANDTLSDLYTGGESWNEICIQSLRESMRSAYEKRSLNLRKQQQAKKDIKEFSIENVGLAYKNTLEKIL